jgi:phage gp29-like protein
VQQCFQNIHQSFLNIIVKRAREGLRRRLVWLYIFGMQPLRDFRIHPELIVKSATF